MLGEIELRQLTDEILKRCAPDDGEVIVSVKDNTLTRFANNCIHQNVAERDVNVLVRLITSDRRIGTATTNRTDPAALDEAVDRARASATSSPPSTDFSGLAGPADYSQVIAFDPSTENFQPERRADGVGIVCRLAKEDGLTAAGAFSTGSREVALANTHGVFAYHPATHADFQTVVMSGDSSGWSQASHWKVGTLNIEALGREAIEKAARGQNPQPIEPGEYSVVLDPYATDDLLSMLNFYGMGALSVQEGRSWMKERMGEQVFPLWVNIWDDALDPRGAPMPFDFQGTPKQKVNLVKDGVVIGPVYDRDTAAKEGRESTGHGLPPTARGMGPVAINLFMQPGDETTADLIAGTQCGLYITRFWYTRLVHPNDCVVTGMTRDGVFLIENGKIVHPVKNLRFTQGYVQALAGLEAVGRETRLLMNEYIGGGAYVPAVKLKAFNFTGMTV